MFNKIRPNILMLEFGLIAVAVLCILKGAYELAGVCVGGMIGFGNQILEKEE